MGRTHLVRGLDRVLLSRVRGDASATTADAADDDVVIPPRAAAVAAAAAAPPFPEKFETAAGRAIATAALRPPAVSCAELFQPRRMAFVFGLVEVADASDSEDEFPGGGAGGDRGVLAIPETLLRSRAECPEPPEGMNAAADAAVLREVAGVAAALRISGKDRKKTKGAEAEQVRLRVSGDRGPGGTLACGARVHMRMRARRRVTRRSRRSGTCSSSG